MVRLIIFQDDNLPSGFVTIKIENIDKLTTYIADGLTKIAEQKQAIPEVQSGDLSFAIRAISRHSISRFFEKNICWLA
jgi:hypothetical protein